MKETFQKIQKIGEGTYGVVYKAKEKSTGKIVALKKIRLGEDREGMPATTIREISLLKDMKHKNIVSLHQVIYAQDKLYLYLVFEYAETDLKKYIERMRRERQTLTKDEIRAYSLQLTSALEYCHSIGVLHRDLKPQNILIKGKQLKLADFGLSRSVGIPLHTLTNEVVTLWYRAPELLLAASHYSTAIDVWSLGCVVCEFVMLKPMFPGDSEIDQLYKMFQLLGTPTEKMWNGVSSTKNYHTEFPYWEEKKIVLKDKECEAFVNDILVYDPVKRPSARTLLKHKYFRS